MASEEARDWRTRLSVLERQRYMYEGRYACDVTFMVGKDNPEKIAAHRFVLVCGSPVFEAMLTEGREGDIVVEDVDPEVFNKMLKFLYCEQIELNEDTAWYVLQAARTYELSQLVEECTNYLLDTIDVHNVCLYLTKSVQYDDNELSAGCIEFISHNIKQVLVSNEFTHVSYQSLMRILESDITYRVSPRELYTACLDWADTQCTGKARTLTDENRRAVLGSCLYLIRFPDMSSKEFTEVTRGSKLLTDAERLQILEYKAHREHGYEFEATMMFNVGKPGVEYRAKRFKDLQGGTWGEAGTSAIDFQYNRSVWITGVGLYVGHNNMDNHVVVKLIDDKDLTLADTGNVVIKKKHDFEIANSHIPIDVCFPKNVHIDCNQLYRITAEYKCEQYRYGTEGQRTVHNRDVTFTFRQSPGNNTTVDQGQIPEIIYTVWDTPRLLSV